MAELTISRGLRKLEFLSDDEARIDFACESPLPAGKTVHIPLGLREGKLRTLVGVPLLLQERADATRPEYLYSLSGPITEQRV